jgi:hypothetical protein
MIRLDDNINATYSGDLDFSQTTPSAGKRYFISLWIYKYSGNVDITLFCLPLRGYFKETVAPFTSMNLCN